MIKSLLTFSCLFFSINPVMAQTDDFGPSEDPEAAYAVFYEELGMVCELPQSFSEYESDYSYNATPLETVQFGNLARITLFYSFFCGLEGRENARVIVFESFREPMQVMKFPMAEAYNTEGDMEFTGIMIDYFIDAPSFDKENETISSFYANESVDKNYAVIHTWNVYDPKYLSLVRLELGIDVYSLRRIF